MLTFNLESLPGRVCFGVGKIEAVAAEVQRLNCSRALVLATPPQKDLADRIAALLSYLSVGVYDRAEMHVPVEVVDEAHAVTISAQADCLVAPGGGSTIGLAKAIALRTALPILAIPTTYAGSEMTPIWGVTEQGRKRTGRDRKVLPRAVIYDPSLLLSLPPAITGPSGLNSVAHAVEALYAPDANPITSIMAEEAIRAFGNSLSRAVEAPSDILARADTMYGAWLAGAALGTVGMGLHHKLCHVLGGTFNLPHADTHAVVLPHVAAFNGPAAPDAMRRVARALNRSDPGEVPLALHELLQRTCTYTSLAAVGMLEDQLDIAADLATQEAYPNPRTFTRQDIRHLLGDAFEGVLRRR